MAASKRLLALPAPRRVVTTLHIRPWNGVVLRELIRYLAENTSCSCSGRPSDAIQSHQWLSCLPCPEYLYPLPRHGRFASQALHVFSAYATCRARTPYRFTKQENWVSTLTAAASLDLWALALGGYNPSSLTTAATTGRVSWLSIDASLLHLLWLALSTSYTRITCYGSPLPVLVLPNGFANEEATSIDLPLSRVDGSRSALTSGPNHPIFWEHLSSPLLTTLSTFYCTDFFCFSENSPLQREPLVDQSTFCSLMLS